MESTKFKLLIKVIFGYFLIILILVISTKFIKHPDIDSTFATYSLNEADIELKVLNNIQYQFKDLIFGDNNRGFPELIVPNVVHYILFNISEIRFAHYLSILSVLKNQKPDLIWIHCDCEQLSGYYYKKVIERVKQTDTQFSVRRVEKPTEIFGKTISKQFINWHSSDITRLRVLSQFGGIYLDTDVYVVKSLDVFRNYEITLNRNNGDVLSNSVIIAHRNARFLKMWIHSYHGYKDSGWTENSQIVPSLQIMDKFPELVHRLTGQFGVYGPSICPMLFLDYYENWKNDFYAIHLFIRGNNITLPDWCLGKRRPNVMQFNETVVRTLNNTFGEMCRQLNV